MNFYDAVIIGAGPAGSTAALLLAQAGRSVAIVEKSAFPRRKVCGEFISAPALSLLARMGIAQGVLDDAGPEVREVAVYAGERIAVGDMPRANGAMPYGRALGRERLDMMLLEAARFAGATVFQPWRVRSWQQESSAYVCNAEQTSGDEAMELRAPIIIAAHGSWDTGGLMQTAASARSNASDLLAFKARFTRAALPAARMPLISFPGGYGGLVHSDEGRVSLSCCIRRDALAACRRETPGLSAGDAVLAHICKSSRGTREALAAGERDAQWLAAGPLQPGIRSMCGAGFFAAGNALGEAHPIVAEGITMAIQSAWLLCERLISAPRAPNVTSWDAIARAYETAYRRNFGLRIRAASAFATIAMRPKAAATAALMLEAAPMLLGLGARFAGKSRPLRVSFEE